MGLDFSHCDARWGYGRFNNFRTRLAVEAGIALNCMEGFAYSMAAHKGYDHVRLFGTNINKHREPGQSTANYTDYIGTQPVISWDKIKDPIKPLLNHSDCDGDLTPDQCREVAPRIRELVKDWPDDDRDKINALLLADGMDLAVNKKENLEFM